MKLESNSVTDSRRTVGQRLGAGLSRLLGAYGMLAVLILLCLYFAAATYHTEYPIGPEAGEQVIRQYRTIRPRAHRPFVVDPGDAAGDEFARRLGQEPEFGARDSGAILIEGDPPAVRVQIESEVRAGRAPDAIVTTRECAQWAVWDSLRREIPSLASLRVVAPDPVARSTFLSPSNLRNVADQIAVIAIIAVGMTLVIITAGIDLSVGSLVALSAVLTAFLIRAWGGASASWVSLAGSSLAAIALCAVVGGFSGLTITLFRVPPFIATLAMMQVASGLAFIVARGQSIYEMPESFTWLGRGTNLGGIPNAVVLMLAIYALAHVFMARTALGRSIYAVGGNPEAARLSGVDTRRTLIFVYVVSGLMAGVGGVITASQLRAGAPTYGLMYELYVIAAVVVGGTSLAGGEGRVMGTLIGAFIIAVIRNGMNLTNVEPYTQKVVLGLVILGAVLLDMLKQRRWRWAAG